MSKILLGLCVLVPASASWAISNIENERPNLPDEGLSGSLRIGLNGKTGNQEERSNEGGAKIIYRSGDEIFMALAEKEYGSTLKVKTTDKDFLHGRWMHLLDDRWAVEGFAQWEKDEFDNLTSRTLAGGGGRYLIAKKQDVYSLALGLGGFYEIEKQNLVSYQETNRLWRINTYYTYKYQLNEQVSLVNTTYIQPNTRDFSDVRVLFDLGISVKLTNSLALQLAYRINYDSDPAKNLFVDPPIDNFKTNTEYKTGVSYSF
ncbi:MAG: DUF481 domain-containing protein [Gammaproteobacteria bacterium]|nr:MAG: DUF481 domain-containing protein [Gammaproteobacteria bacterium]